MILIHTALPLEGKVLKDALELKMESHPAGLRIYSNSQYRLVVSGPGALSTASALGYAFALKDAYAGALNFGIAGCPPGDNSIGQLHFIRSVRSVTAQSYRFVDVIWRHDLPEADLESWDRPVRASDNPDRLVDLEGFAFFSTAQRWLNPHQTLSLKWVSDACDPDAIDPAVVTEGLQKAFSQVHSLLKGWPGFQLAEIDPGRVTALALVEKITSRLSLSVTQRLSLTVALIDALKRGQAPERFEKALDQLPQVSHKRDRNRLFLEFLDVCRA